MLVDRSRRVVPVGPRRKFDMRISLDPYTRVSIASVGESTREENVVLALSDDRAFRQPLSYIQVHSAGGGRVPALRIG